MGVKNILYPPLDKVWLARRLFHIILLNRALAIIHDLKNKNRIIPVIEVGELEMDWNFCDFLQKLKLPAI